MTVSFTPMLAIGHAMLVYFIEFNYIALRENNNCTLMLFVKTAQIFAKQSHNVNKSIQHGCRYTIQFSMAADILYNSAWLQIYYTIQHGCRYTIQFSMAADILYNSAWLQIYYGCLFYANATDRASNADLFY